MANVIMIDMKDGGNYLEFPLLDDVTPQLESTYGSLGEIFGGFSEMINTVNTITTQVNGNLTGLGALGANAMSYPVWKSTSPMKLPLRLLFYLGADGMTTGKDLKDKMDLFIERASISKVNGGLAVPGLSLGEFLNEKDLKKLGNQTTSKNVKSKLVNIVIPGIIQMRKAFITSISPTYSRQKTSDGYPIWGMLDMQFSGIVMAVFEDNFKDIPTYETLWASQFFK